MIVCVGPIFLDRVVNIDSFPEKPIKLVANSLEKRLGGPAPVASFAIKLLGEESEYIGRFGDDDAADFLQSEFDKHEISYHRSLIVKDALSSQSHIFEDRNGERMLAVFNEEKLLQGKKLPIFDFSARQTYLIDTNWIEASHHIAFHAHEKGINCIVDLDNFSNSKQVEEVVNFASHPIFSETGLYQYLNEKSVINSLENLYHTKNKFYAVTLGSEGAYWVDGGKIFHCEAPKVEARETNGAGDVFHGAFARFIHANKSIQESIELATAAATLKCSKIGGISAIPSFKEVVEFSKQLKPSKIIKQL